LVPPPVVSFRCQVRITSALFTPHGLTVETCEVLYQHTNLLVLGPPPDYIFLMKLYAARAPDYDDLVALWPSCTFHSPQEAVDRFVQAYPRSESCPSRYKSRYKFAAHSARPV
jgi:hypothetical protein